VVSCSLHGRPGGETRCASRHGEARVQLRACNVRGTSTRTTRGVTRSQFPCSRLLWSRAAECWLSLGGHGARISHVAWCRCMNALRIPRDHARETTTRCGRPTLMGKGYHAQPHVMASRESRSDKWQWSSRVRTGSTAVRTQKDAQRHDERCWA